MVTEFSCNITGSADVPDRLRIRRIFMNTFSRAKLILDSIRMLLFKGPPPGDEALEQATYSSELIEIPGIFLLAQTTDLEPINFDWSMFFITSPPIHLEESSHGRN